jgi:NAD(P)H-dependent flavin oxidoreductase YrpB (nitropropane dioxygenase family)
VPVVAAGGIFDGRGLADDIWVGTRFIATPEAHVVSGYREALVDGREDDTVITPAYTGKTLRAVRNAYTQHFEEHPDELQPFPDQIGRSLGDGRDVPAGTPGDVAAALIPYLQAGCRTFNLLTQSPDPSALPASVGEVRRLLAAA